MEAKVQRQKQLTIASVDKLSLAQSELESLKVKTEVLQNKIEVS
jgi:hypothetical protein